MLPQRIAAPLAVLTLLGSGLAALATAPATAAPPTCQGQPATIVGRQGQERLNGTDGADVIVTGGAVHVFALGGDDLICARSEFEVDGTIDAGSGDDAVEVQRSLTRLVLGDGSDRVWFRQGGSRQKSIDTVYAGTPTDGGTRPIDEDDRQVDDDADSIDLRNGGGSVDQLYLGQDGIPLTDRVRLQSRFRTYVYARGSELAATGQLVGDATSQLIYLAEPDTSPWTIHLGAQRSGAAASGARRWEWTRMSVTWTTAGSVRLTGSAGSEGFTGPVTAANLGAGDDYVNLTTPPATDASGSFDGGPGVDSIALSGGEDWRTAEEIVVRVPSRRVRFGSGSRARSSRLIGFESFIAESARTVELVGGAGPEELRGRSCDLHLMGGDGDDYLENLYYGGSYSPLTCRQTEPSRRSRLLGEGGDDLIEGGSGFAPELLDGGVGNDRLTSHSGGSRLFGGSGNDVLTDESSGAPVSGDGGPGTDVCTGIERRTSCER